MLEQENEILRRAAVYLALSTSAAFYVGDVAGLGEQPPNYVEDDDAAIQAGIAGWRSNLSPVHAVFLDPDPG